MRILNNVEMAALTETLSDLAPAILGTNDYDINLNQTNNKLVITFTEKDYKVQFEDYLKTLDDDIFTAACEYYTHKTGQDLSRIKDITPELIANFKQAVKVVVNRKIESLHKYL